MGVAAFLMYLSEAGIANEEKRTFLGDAGECPLEKSRLKSVQLEAVWRQLGVI